MSLSLNTKIEVRTAAGVADTNGGGFVTGASGTDYSQQASAQYALSNGVTNGTTTIGLSAASADMVGNVAYVAGGTGSVAGNWYQVASMVAGVSITVDRSTGLTAGTGVTVNIGGALASPGAAGAILAVSSQGVKIWVKSDGIYTISSTSSNVSGGIVSVTAGIMMEGYSSVRGDLGTPPTFQVAASGVTSVTVVTVGNHTSILNIKVDGQSKSTILGFSFGRTEAYKCTAQNCTNGGFSAGFGLVACLATGCSTVAAFTLQGAYRCEAYGNSVAGFVANSSSGISLVQCLSYSNSGASSDGFSSTALNFQIVGCTAYGNGRDGFRLTGSDAILPIDCVAEGNTGFGFNLSSATLTCIRINCAAYNNTGGATSGTLQRDFLFVTGTATFFVDAANGNFALNNKAGGGALLRAAGFGTFPRGTTISLGDIGAAQSRVPWHSLKFDGGLDG